MPHCERSKIHLNYYRYATQIHRVINPTNETDYPHERSSVVFFAMADDDVVVKPLDGSTVRQATTAGSWLTSKLNRSYDLV